MSIKKTDKLLVLVESPNKTKAVAKIMNELGYEKVKVMATVGHTTQIKNVRGSYKNTGIYPDKKFKITYEIMPDKHKVVDSIKEQAKWADLILIASDPDREGENLGNHIKDLIKVKEDKYFRITYQSITKTAIQYALEHPTKMDINLCNAAEARQVVDKMIGYSLSPIAKTYIGARSVGRCQSIGLKCIVDRENEIKNFIPSKYYDLYLNFKKDNLDFQAKYIGTPANKIDHLELEKDVGKVKKECIGPFIIESIQNKEKQEVAKPPFCTATYQQEISNRLGLKVKDAMSCAQKLFEAGKITYHRTDSLNLSDDFVKQTQDYINLNFPNLFLGAQHFKKMEGEQGAHEAIRPTDPTLTPELFEAQEQNSLLTKVYKIIWQRAIQSLLKPAIYELKHMLINNNNHLFELELKKLKNKGFKELSQESQEAENILFKIDFKEGELLEDTYLDAQEKTTSPKPRYKEASLIKELQKKEVGRPSTYATIVDTVLSPIRGYCTIKDKVIFPTEKGIQLANFLDRSFANIINYEYTKNLEICLDNIATGKVKELDFLENFYQTLETTIEANTESNNDLDKSENKLCPKCGAPMVMRRSRFGKLFYGCSNYPKCNGIINID